MCAYTGARYGFIKASFNYICTRIDLNTNPWEFITDRVRSMEEGNIFTGVCHSVNTWWGGVCLEREGSLPSGRGQWSACFQACIYLFVTSVINKPILCIPPIIGGFKEVGCQKTCTVPLVQLRLNIPVHRLGNSGPLLSIILDR